MKTDTLCSGIQPKKIIETIKGTKIESRAQNKTFPVSMYLNLETYLLYQPVSLRARQKRTLSKPQPSFQRHNIPVIYLETIYTRPTLRLTKPDGADRFAISECRARICRGCGDGWTEEGGEEGTQWVWEKGRTEALSGGNWKGIFFLLPLHLPSSHSRLPHLLHSESSFSYL